MHIANIKNIFSFRSLAQRIVASVIIGLALILVLFGLVAHWTTRDATESAYRERVILAQTLATSIDDVLRYSLETLKREAVDLPGSPTSLNDLRLRLGSFSSVTVTDSTGVVIWTNPSSSNIVVGQRLDNPAVDVVLANGQAEIAESRGEGQKIFASLGVPLKDSSGRLTGALMAELDPGHPAANLLPSQIARGIQVQLMDVQGNFLAGTENANRGAKEHQALLADLMAAHRSGYVIHEPKGGATFPSHVVAYAPLSLLPSWGVAIEQPTDIVLAMPRQLEERQIVFGFVSLLFAAAVAWVSARYVIEPLKHLTAVAERFAAGQLDEPVLLNRVDELGILGGAFETMRERLRNSLDEVAEWNRELERRVASRTVEIERRNRELAHLNAIAETLSGSLNVKVMLEHTLEHVIQITGADAGCFWTLDGESAVLAAKAGPIYQTNAPDPERCVCLKVARLNRSIVVQHEDIGGEVVPAALAIPVHEGDRVHGILLLTSSDVDHFDQTDLPMMSAIGRHVGIALANAGLYQSLELRERERGQLLQRVMDAQEEERRRLAQELHDETSQSLSSLRLGLERLSDAEGSLTKDLANELQGIAAQALADVHRLAVELRPSVLDDVGLIAAIFRYVAEMRQRFSGLQIDFMPVGLDNFRLSSEAETAIYRVVQAALTNVVEHAKAKHVSVLLERRGEKLVAVVEDDGKGFDLEHISAGPLETRLGLAGMMERASLINGTLTIETTPGCGTTIFLEVPLEGNLPTEVGKGEIADRTG